MKECPYCGYHEYYVEIYMSGYGIYNRRFDGKEVDENDNVIDNSDMYNSLKSKEFKTAYCGNCHKKIGNISKIIENGKEENK